MFAYTGGYGKLARMTSPLPEQVVIELPDYPELSLSPFTSEDLEGLLQLFHDPQVRRYLWDDILVPESTVSEVIGNSLSDFERGACGLFSIHSTRSEEAEGTGASSPLIAGFCGLRQLDDAPLPELLYGLLPGYWGQGIVDAACRAVMRYAFVHCEVEMLTAATDYPNTASQNVLKRLGMTFEGRRMQHTLDTLFYSINLREAP